MKISKFLGLVALIGIATSTTTLAIKSFSETKQDELIESFDNIYSNLDKSLNFNKLSNTTFTPDGAYIWSDLSSEIVKCSTGVIDCNSQKVLLKITKDVYNDLLEGKSYLFNAYKTSSSISCSKLSNVTYHLYDMDDEHLYLIIDTELDSICMNFESVEYGENVEIYLIS